MKAAPNMIGPPVGDPEPPVLPLEYEARKELAAILQNLGHAVHLSPVVCCWKEEI